MNNQNIAQNELAPRGPHFTMWSALYLNANHGQKETPVFIKTMYTYDDAFCRRLIHYEPNQYKN